MTTELGNSDASRAAGRHGLSRRQMIKASAVAGAAACTAPVIIDSLASPAAAGSACIPYWVKILDDSTSQSFNCPGSTTFDVCDAWWANDGNPPQNCVSGCCPSGYCGKAGDAQHGAHMPTANDSDGDYRKVTLNTGCTFQSTTGWQIGGRYSGSSGSDTYLKITTACIGNVPSGDGCYGTGSSSNIAWVKKTNGSKSIAYVYLKFCCDS